MPPLTIPPDLTGDLSDTLARDRDHPAVAAFLGLVAGDTNWSSAWPKRLLAFAEALGINVAGVASIASSRKSSALP
jgi:hypothetical protein